MKDNYVTRDPNYELGFEVLSLILKKEEIPNNLLYSFMDKDLVNEFKAHQYELYNNPNFIGGTPRVHNPYAPTEIAENRRSVQRNPVYKTLHLELLHGRLPALPFFEYFFGNDAEQIRTIYALFQQYHKYTDRDGDIPALAHVNRVGCTGWESMGETLAKRIAATIGGSHDFGEDILPIHRDRNGKLFGLERYDEFFDLYVPKSVREPTEALTNYRSMFIKQASFELRHRNVASTFDNIRLYLKKEYSKMSNKNSLKNRLEKLLINLESPEIVARYDPDDVVDSLKKIIYPYYSQDIVRLCVEKNDFKPGDIKCIDLSDNGHGKSDSEFKSRRKNIIKRTDFVYLADLENNALPKKNWLFDKKLRELEEDALTDAHNLLIEKLITPESHQDYDVSAFNSIIKLQSALYSGYPSLYYYSQNH